MSKLVNNILVRPLAAADIEGVAAVSRECYPCTPIGADDLDAILGDLGCGILVAEHYGDLCGYLVYTVEPDAFYVCDLAVVPAKRRLWVATTLVSQMLCRLDSNRPHLVAFCPRESVSGGAFLRSLGMTFYRCIRASETFAFRVTHPVFGGQS